MKKKKNYLIYDWSVKDYIKYVQDNPNPVVEKYETEELDYLKTQIENSQKKTFIDVGGGYGRALSTLATISRNVISVEINPNMYEELDRRSGKYPNAKAMKGDANNLSQLLETEDVIHPVVICLQNSIGTWEGDYKQAIAEMGKFAKEKQGEVIISAWLGEKFREYAEKAYGSIKFVGKPDLRKTDFEKCFYVSEIGYSTRWWLKPEREEMEKILGGKTVKETLGVPYFILHFSYT